MKKISNPMFFTKKVFPGLWFALLVVFLGIVIYDGSYATSPMYIIVPVLMTVFGLLLMKKVIWTLADEVYDCGDSLLVKNRGKEERVPFSNIININVATHIRPPRITLTLRNPGKFGPEIAFSPMGDYKVNPLAKNQVAEDLIAKVERAKINR